MKKIIFVVFIVLFLPLFSLSEVDYNTLAYFWAGRNFEEKGEIEKAKEIYKKIEGKIPDVYYYLSGIYLKEEKYDLAIENLLKLKEIKNYKELAFTSLVASLDIEAEIKRVKDEKKRKEEEQKKNIEKLDKEFLLLKPYPCNVFLEREGNVKIMKGEIDNLGLIKGKRLILIKGKETVGEVEITEVKRIYSTGKIILISEKIKKLEGILVADKIKIREEK